MRKYQQLVNQEKPQRNPLGMKIEIGEDQGSDQSGGFAEATPQQIKARQQRDFKTPLAMGGQHTERTKSGQVSGSILMRSHRKGLGMSLASTRSRGSNKRSFNIMTSRGSANKPFLFGEGKGSEAARQSLRNPSGAKGGGPSLELRGLTQSALASARKPLLQKTDGKGEAGIMPGKPGADE